MGKSAGRENSDWRMVFLEGNPPALPKFLEHKERFGRSRYCLTQNFSAHQKMCLSIFSACFSRLRFLRHRLQSVDKWEGEAPAEPSFRLKPLAWVVLEHTGETPTRYRSLVSIRHFFVKIKDTSLVRHL